MLIFSGGLDSAVTAYKLRNEGVTLSLLSFNYGQRYVKELTHAADLAEQLDVSHDIVDLRSLGRILGGSALTDPGIAVPHGHYRAETMRSTVVPNRNAIMLKIAAGAAVAAGADAVAFGAHSGDHAIYPDCRPEFFALIEASVKAGNAGHIGSDFQLVAPFLELTKADIVREGVRLGAQAEVAQAQAVPRWGLLETAPAAAREKALAWQCARARGRVRSAWRARQRRGSTARVRPGTAHAGRTGAGQGPRADRSRLRPAPRCSACGSPTASKACGGSSTTAPPAAPAPPRGRTKG
ncbi:7-cyano-7-deazaguanine synthase [Streptomyces collinus]